jgi:hypothetical protein
MHNSHVWRLEEDWLNLSSSTVGPPIACAVEQPCQRPAENV